jgi:membrane fusion protein (multidrug efflux system)
MTKRMLIMIGGILLLVLILAGGFALHVRTLIASAPKPYPQTVTTTKVTALEWQPSLAAVGSVTAVRGVDVTTEIAGLVREIHFQSGQDVRKGDVLVQLNADTDQAQLLSLKAAADLSNVTLKRDRAQFQAQAIAQAQVDNDAADLKSKQALVAQQQATIDKKTIRAPFSGRLGITTVNPGQYLNPGDKIVTLQTISPIYVDFNLPQKSVGSLAVGQVVNVITDGFPGVQFPARKGASGASAPAPAAAASGSGLVVQQAFVTTGETRGDQVAILKGLKEGQQVVTSGQLKLKNGTSIVVDNSISPANAINPTPQEH